MKYFLIKICLQRQRKRNHPVVEQVAGWFLPPKFCRRTGLSWHRLPDPINEVSCFSHETNIPSLPNFAFYFLKNIYLHFLNACVYNPGWYHFYKVDMKNQVRPTVWQAIAQEYTPKLSFLSRNSYTLWWFCRYLPTSSQPMHAAWLSLTYIPAYREPQMA